MDFFYNSICHFCKKIETGLKRCASCRFVAYCSKDHQLYDWKNHKRMCKLLSDFKQVIHLEHHCEYNRWRLYRLQLKFYLEQKLGRSLFSHESQMWMFPRNCGVCYSSQCLKDCQECFCVVYCSSEHKSSDRERHNMVCSKLKLCLQLDRFYKSKTETIIKFKKVHRNVECLPETIHKSIELFVDISELCNYLEEVFVTDVFASMLTILYGLENCKCLIKRKLLIGNLIIHIVGANISEMFLNWKHMTDLLQLWIKNLKKCEIILIGPELKIYSDNSIVTENIHFECISDFYHNVVEKKPKPDIIIAFNSGIHEFQCSEADDTWNKSLSYLVNNDAPLLLTAYTKSEIEKDLQRLNCFSYVQILRTQINPFANLRPIRDWDSINNEPFHVNGYIAIISGSEYARFTKKARIPYKANKT